MTDDIKAIRDALAAGPTPGPWWIDDDIAGVYINGNGLLLASMQALDPHPTDAGDFSDGPVTEATGRYIAACHPERIARLLDALEQASKDAERYRWLRSQHWSDSTLAVVRNPKDAVKLGHQCPSLDNLDAAIDAAMSDAPGA